MSRIQYEKWDAGADALEMVRQANAICATYQAQGYDLTLRQLYYQFVARDLLANNQRNYKRLGDVVNRARLAGLLDWDYIVDRTRNLESVNHWETPGEIIDAVARQFRLDKWTEQPTRIEVWVEKEALAGVIEQVASRLDVAWFACRGYVSQSEMWSAAQRLGGYVAKGQRVILLHLGDHDPSGIDMTRDIAERLDQFIITDSDDYLTDLAGEEREEYASEVRRRMASELRATPDEDYAGDPNEEGGCLEVRRIALNWDQVQQYNPPPNPAKLTDSRATGYIARFGTESWELDALEPSVLDALIETHVDAVRDEAAYDTRREEEATHRRLLAAASTRWAEVAGMLA